MAELSPAEVEELIECFEMFDKNRDGTISVEELGSILRALGQNPTKAQVDDIMKKADKNGDGVLSKAEYVSLISGYMVDPEVVKAELREAFMTFDKLKRGYLDLKQMSKALRCVGEPLSEIEIKQLIKLADKNNDGKIDVDEKRLIRQVPVPVMNCPANVERICRLFMPTDVRLFQQVEAKTIIKQCEFAYTSFTICPCSGK